MHLHDWCLLAPLLMAQIAYTVWLWGIVNMKM